MSKCGTVITIPAAEMPADQAVAPAPSAPFDFDAPAPAKKSPPKPPVVEDDYDGEDELPLSRGKSARDDDELDDEELPDEEFPDEEDEDDRSRRKKKKRKSIRKSEQSIGLSLTSMILGIVSVLAGTGGCCIPCLGIWTSPLPFLLGAGAIGTGIFGLKQGGQGFAITGLVCGGVGLLEALVAIGFFVLWGGANVMGIMFG
jgi:hypothetical protein